MNDSVSDFFDDGPPDGPELQNVEDMIEEVQSDVPPSDYNQQMLLSYLISNPAMWVKCAPIIKTDYFDREYKPVIKFIENHLKKYQDMPNGTQVHASTGILLDHMEDAKKESNETWLCDSVEEFCRTQAYKDHIIKASEIIEQDKSRNALAALQKEAADIERISLHRNLGYEVHKDAAKILSESEKFDNITTGSIFLDRALSGGLNRPSFNMISCASGDGKSIFLKNMAVNAAEQGENCIFYSLELAEPTIMKRFGAMMTGTAMDNIYGSLDTVAYSLKVRDKTDGNIWIVKFPMGGTTIADIASHFLELTLEMQTKHNPDFNFGFVAIDYLDLMYPVEAIERSNLHLKDKYVSEEVNEWTHKNKLITWSASQQTKGAQDEAVARQSGVSGGTGKVWTCDNLLIGKRSEEDKEDERWWAHIEKNRDGAGTKRKVPFRWDSETQRMTDGDMDKFQEANPTMFGRKRAKQQDNTTSERVTKDALVREQGGVDIPSTKDKESGRSEKATDTLNRLRQMQGARNGG